MAGDVELTINSTYTRTAGSHDRAMSFELRAAAGHRTGPAENEAKVEDLHKIYTYRMRSPRCAPRAFLYPGEETSAFGEERSIRMRFDNAAARHYLHATMTTLDLWITLNRADSITDPHLSTRIWNGLQ